MAENNGEQSTVQHVKQIIDRYIEEKIAELEEEMNERYGDRIRNLEDDVRRAEQRLRDYKADVQKTLELAHKDTNK